MFRRAALLAVLQCLAGAPIAAQAATDLLTHAERTAFVETGRYAEVESLCRSYQQAYPTAVRCVEFGRTPEGRPMLAIVASQSGALDPAAARRRGLPVLLAQGGIHAGEIEGKDAGFIVLRELLAGRQAAGVLAKAVFVFVPVFNVDGHERFGAWHRPNQNGPREMGWRTTAQNLNLNRDYMKADAPEMRAMLGLLNAWDPIVYADLHTTDGADFQVDISVQVEPLFAGDAGLRPLGLALRDRALADLTAAGFVPVPFYPSFVKDDEPASGFENDVSTPRFSLAYWALHNRFGVLVETHSWKPYQRRVEATRDTLYSLLKQLGSAGSEWLRAAAKADAAAAGLGGQQLALDFDPGTAVHMIDFPGYEYRYEASEISGKRRVIYDPSRKAVWTVPYRDQVEPSVVARLPKAGYWVPAAEAGALRSLLEAHGIVFSTLNNDLQDISVSTYKVDTFEFATQTFEGRTRLTSKGHWVAGQARLSRGSLFVPLAQARARVVANLFEPTAPDSLLGWGNFNRSFEQKEYMEDYVAEQEARRMLAADPALKAEYEDRLQSDQGFAADSSARLEFFYRRHPAWDTRFATYPVMAADAPPPQ